MNHKLLTPQGVVYEASLAKGLRSGAWIRNRTDGRFALVEEVADGVVIFWKEEVATLQGCAIDEFHLKWSIFHGYRVYGQKEAPDWVNQGVYVYERSSGVRCRVLSVRLKRAWVMIEATPWLRTHEHRWLTVRTGNAFTRDFAYLPDRFDRPEPV